MAAGTVLGAELGRRLAPKNGGRQHDRYGSRGSAGGLAAGVPVPENRNGSEPKCPRGCHGAVFFNRLRDAQISKADI